MQLQHLRDEIHQRHQNGESYQKLAYEFHISKPMVRLIEMGYHPGKKVSLALHLDPSPDLLYTRSRRHRLDDLARTWGYATWCAYETWMLDKHRNHQMILLDKEASK